MKMRSSKHSPMSTSFVFLWLLHTISTIYPRGMSSCTDTKSIIAISTVTTKIYFLKCASSKANCVRGQGNNFPVAKQVECSVGYSYEKSGSLHGWVTAPHFEKNRSLGRRISTMLTRGYLIVLVNLVHRDKKGSCVFQTIPRKYWWSL